MMKLQWVRLANGFHYAPAIFVQVGRHSRSGPVVVRTPLERDENFEDGWLWSDAVDSVKHTDAHFGNVPDAMAWVETHTLILRTQVNWDYDGKPKLAPRKLTRAQSSSGSNQEKPMAAKSTTDTRPLLSAETVENVRARRPFKKAVAGLIGYITTGGTYVLATAPNWTDDDRARDLVAILPGDLGHGRVLPLYIGTNPDVVAYLETQLADA